VTIDGSPSRLVPAPPWQDDRDRPPWPPPPRRAPRNGEPRPDAPPATRNGGGPAHDPQETAVAAPTLPQPTVAAPTVTEPTAAAPTTAAPTVAAPTVTEATDGPPTRRSRRSRRPARPARVQKLDLALARRILALTRPYRKLMILYGTMIVVAAVVTALPGLITKSLID
jgi:hypothetical protein